MGSVKLSPILKKQKKPKPFGVADLEWNNKKTLMVGFYNGETYVWFKTVKAFFLHLHTSKVEQIFCHFGGSGGGDFLRFLDYVSSAKGFVVENYIPRGSRILSFDIILPNERRVRFSDSGALLPFKLESITEDFKVAHKKKDLDVSNLQGVTPELVEYCGYDCIGLHECLQIFYSWDVIAKAGPATTIAGQALRVFRTMLKEPMWAPGKAYQAFARRAYLGGRTEIFRPICEVKDGPLHGFDVTSLYPYAMLGEFPIGRPCWVYEMKPGKLGIYHARVTVPDMFCPPLGVIIDSKYVFPVGEFEGHWTSAELEYAKTLGVKVKIIKGVYWSDRARVFEEYVLTLFDKRSKAVKGSVTDILCKLLLNSLYGRFGMEPEKENLVFEAGLGTNNEPDFTVGRGKTKTHLWRQKVTLESYFNVALSAFVTSYGRIHMHKIYRELGEDLYYTDTDSVYTTKIVPSSTLLGGLKYEGACESAVFLLPKTYHLEFGAPVFDKGLADKKLGIKGEWVTKKTVMKGFEYRKIKGFTEEDFLAYFEGEKKRLTIPVEARFATVKVALKQNKFLALLKPSNKTLKAIYTKREIVRTDKGITTKPLRIGEQNE